MLNVYIYIRSAVFTPGASIQKQSRAVERVDFFFYCPDCAVGRVFNFVPYAINRKRRMIISRIYYLFEKIVVYDGVARRNHFFEIVVYIMRRTKFYMYEHSEFVGNA